MEIRKWMELLFDVRGGDFIVEMFVNRFQPFRGTSSVLIFKQRGEGREERRGKEERKGCWFHVHVHAMTGEGKQRLLFLLLLRRRDFFDTSSSRSLRRWLVCLIRTICHPYVSLNGRYISFPTCKGGVHVHGIWAVPPTVISLLLFDSGNNAAFEVLLLFWTKLKFY